MGRTNAGGRMPIPEEVTRKWQNVVNVMAELVNVPAALIMKAEPPYIEVFCSSETAGNPYNEGEREHLTGLYCERVISTRRKLLIPNALKDEEWKENPDVKLGMISYLGYPLLWPDGGVFGTICILDAKENRYGKRYEELVSQFRELIESHLNLLDKNRILEGQKSELEARLREIKTLRGLLPICSSCKKIRDDGGYWRAVESYICERTGVGFTHSLCPECAEKFLADLEKE